MILQNTITIFDFRIYLFARQVQLLFRVVNGPHEICNRAKQFIYSFARTIQEYKVCDQFDLRLSKKVFGSLF